MDGAVDAISQQEGDTRVSGWASDGSHRGPATQVLVFLNGKAIKYGHKVVRRPDLVEGFNTPSLLEAGFDVLLPKSVLEQDRTPVVRVFAISPTGIASELRYPPDYKYTSEKRHLSRR